MARTKARKRKTLKEGTNDAVKSIQNKLSKKEKRKLKQKSKTKSRPEPDSKPDPETLIETLLEPYSKDQLVSIAADLALTHDAFFSLLKTTADQDVSHRKIFVHGLGFETTRQTLEPILDQFGPVEDIHVVIDRSTGKCKGYGFVTFSSRESAQNLLKTPKLRVGSRTVYCQLASLGRTSPNEAHQLQNFVPQQLTFAASDYPERKIYVSNVPVDAAIDKLRSFFEKFGEIESGPKGFDPETGRFSRNYAIFVYKTVEGAKKVLQDQNKVFDGVKLNCRKAESKGSGAIGGAASITTALQPVQPQMLAAAAVQQQNVGLLGHQQAQGGLCNASLGPLMAGYYGLMGLGMGLGGIGNGGLPGGFNAGVIPGLQYLYPNMQNVLGTQMAPTLGNPNVQGGIASMPNVSGPTGSANSQVATGGTMMSGLQFPFPNLQSTHMAASLVPELGLGSSGAPSDLSKQALHNLYPSLQSGAALLVGNRLGTGGGGQLETGSGAVQCSQPNVRSGPSLAKGSGTMGGSGYRPTL